MAHKRNLIVICFVTALLVALICGASTAQQTPAPGTWPPAPSNALLVAAYDGSAGNPSIQVLAKSETPEAREIRAGQRAAMHKAVENLATLFGVSLDFAKDIESWAGDQWAFVLLPDDKGGVQPVFMIASTNASEANAALQKLLAPWERVGEVSMQLESECLISSFKMKDKGIEIYASAYGPVAAISPSKTSLIQAVKGTGFAAGSAGDKVLKALSGSLLYVYADASLLKQFGMKGDQVPVSGFGLGVSTLETGMKVRMLGLMNENGAAMLKQIFASQQPGAVVANPSIPSSSLVAASLPDLGFTVKLAGMTGMSQSPIFGAIQELGDLQVSGAITAVLPKPAGVISAMATSDQAAADKMAKIAASMKQADLSTKPVTVSGIEAMAVGKPGDIVQYLAQSGKYIVLASDAQSLSSTVEAIKSSQPGVSQSATYKETIAGLEGSNLLTLYVNLAPVQGLGFLIEGLGFGQMAPLYGSIAKGLENKQALGIGAGFDGEMANATIFLRAKLGTGPQIGPSVIAGTAISAAVLFPVFARAREAARIASCQSNLKNLALAAQIYVNEHGGRLPTSANWRSQLKKYTEAELRCPDGESIYAFNKNLSGVYLSKIENPADTVMFFEADRDLPNASGSMADAILPHNGWGIFAFVDGHVEKLSEVPERSQWAPPAPPKPVKKAPVRVKKHK